MNRIANVPSAPCPSPENRPTRRDPVTGMLEKGEFLERLGKVLEHCREVRLAVAVALFEINNLTQMRTLSSRLWETAQDQDIPGRVQTERLALVLLGSGRFQALALAECAIQDVCCCLDAQGIDDCGIRAGVAASVNARETADALLDLAAHALESASSASRAPAPERVRLFRSEMEPVERDTLVLAEEKRFLFGSAFRAFHT